MKNIFRIKSMMLTVFAMLAVGMMSLSLTSCHDDNDDKVEEKLSIYSQWQLDEASYNLYASLVGETPEEIKNIFSAIAVDFRTEAVVEWLGKSKSDGKWYSLGRGYGARIVPESETSGGFDTNDDRYEIKGGKLYYTCDGVEWVCIPVKDIVSSGDFIPPSVVIGL